MADIELLELNCWEYMKCSDSSKKDCSVFINKEGRRCWLMTGTKCHNTFQNNIMEKMKCCHACDFYKLRKGVAA